MKLFERKWFLHRQFSGYASQYYGPYTWFGARLRKLPTIDEIRRAPGMVDDR